MGVVMIKTISLMLLAVLTSSPGFAQSAGVSSYFCVEEYSGGFKYNGQMKRWEGVSFRPDGKFLLRIKHERIVTVREDWGPPFTPRNIEVPEFTVTITASGSNTPIPCTEDGRPNGFVASTNMRGGTGPSVAEKTPF
jgi:hypothetical protein